MILVSSRQTVDRLIPPPPFNIGDMKEQTPHLEVFG